MAVELENFYLSVLLKTIISPTSFDWNKFLFLIIRDSELNFEKSNQLSTQK